MIHNGIRIAVQRDGRLRAGSLALLARCGLTPQPEAERALVVPCVEENVSLLYVRHRDIPRYVELGAAELGIVGADLLAEQKTRCQPVARLGFGRCRLVIAVPASSPVRHPSELTGERIATSYPITLRRFLARQHISASVIELSGSVEVAPALGLADAICDIVETGNTLRANNLVPVAEVAEWEAVLITNPEAENPEVSAWVAKITREVQI